MKVLLLVLLLLPQVAAARVYMCVDPATGTKSFTDHGCQASSSREEVRIQATNANSGSRTARSNSVKTWVSDRDTRKTGREYSAERRRLIENNATASASAIGESDDS